MFVATCYVLESNFLFSVCPSLACVCVSTNLRLIAQADSLTSSPSPVANNSDSPTPSNKPMAAVIVTNSAALTNSVSNSVENHTEMNGNEKPEGSNSPPPYTASLMNGNHGNVNTNQSSNHGHSNHSNTNSNQGNGCYGNTNTNTRLTNGVVRVNGGLPQDETGHVEQIYDIPSGGYLWTQCWKG